MKKNILLLVSCIVVFSSCNEDDNVFDAFETEKAPVILFDKIPELFFDLIERETAAFEVTLVDPYNTVEKYSLSVYHTLENGEVLAFENYLSIDNFPYELSIQLSDVAEKLGLTLSEIEPFKDFQFISTITGKNGITYIGKSYDYNSPGDLEEKEGVLVYVGDLSQEGSFDSELISKPELKGAINFTVQTYFSPPPIFRFTSFEEPFVGAERYCNDGHTLTENADLINKPGEPAVDWVAQGDSVDDEIGFDTVFIDEGDSGFLCEIIGVQSDTDHAQRWPHGKQGWHAEDMDGRLRTTFDRVEIPAEHPQTGIRLDIFLNNTSYEGTDLLHIYVDIERDGGVERIDLINIGPDAMEELSDGERWVTIDSGLLEGVRAYTATVDFISSSNSEAFYMDYLLIYLPRP